MTSNELHLQIKPMRQPVFLVTVPSDGSVEDLKREIHRESDVDPNRQRLLFMGRVLKVDQPLSTYNLKENDKLQLIINKNPVQPRNDEPPPAQPAQSQAPSVQPSVQGMAVVGVAAEDFNLDQIMSNVLGSLGHGGDGPSNLISNMIQRQRSGSQNILPNMIRIMPTTREMNQRLDDAEDLFHEATNTNVDAMDVDDAARLAGIADAVLAEENAENDSVEVEFEQAAPRVEEKQVEDTIDDVVNLLRRANESLFNAERTRYFDETIALLANHAATTENRLEIEDRIRLCGEIISEYGTVLASAGVAMRRVQLGETTEEASLTQFIPPQQIQLTALMRTGVNGGSNQSNQNQATVDVDIDMDGQAHGDGADPNNVLDGLLRSFGQPEEAAPATELSTSSQAQNNTSVATHSTQPSQPANPMAQMMQSVAQMMGGNASAGGNQAMNPFQMLSGMFRQPNQATVQGSVNEGVSSVPPEHLVTVLGKEIVKRVEIASVAACRNGDWSVLRTLHAPLRAFLRETRIFDGVATRRSQLSRDLTLGLSRLIVGRFANDRRDVLRTVTESHFRSHTRRLVDIVVDSQSAEAFEDALLAWGSEALTAWIYKLSVNFDSGINGVKNSLSHLGVQWLGSLGVRGDRLHVVPEFIKHFVDSGYQSHVARLQEHGTRARLSQSDEWAYSQPPEDRKRVLDTVHSDSRRAQMQALPRGYQFSPAYTGRHVQSEEDDPASSGIREQE